MSVHSVSRFVAHLALDYEELKIYRSEPKKYLVSKKAAKKRFGGLTAGECKLLESGDFDGLFEYLAENAPRPIQDKPPWTSS